MLRVRRRQWLGETLAETSRIVPGQSRQHRPGFLANVIRAGCIAFAALALGATLEGCSNAQFPLTSSQQTRMESHAQDIIQPLIRGVAYDPNERRAYYSACAPQEYECDLYSVDLDASEPRAAILLESSEYGFVWPSLSPNGSSLVAVRVPRGERLSDRNENQNLVEIDLASGATRVLANALGGRFTRVEHLAEDTIAVVRTYRSSPSFACRGDLCTDRGEVLLWRAGATTTLPMRTGENERDVTFLPLRGRSVWVIVSARYPHIANTQAAYVVDAANNRRESFSTRREALDYVLEEGGSAQEWDGAIIQNGSYWVEQLPFYRQPPLSLVVLQQTHIVSSRLAIGLEKRLSGEFIFQVCENQGRAPWDCSATRFRAP